MIAKSIKRVTVTSLPKQQKWRVTVTYTDKTSARKTTDEKTISTIMVEALDITTGDSREV